MLRKNCFIIGNGTLPCDLSGAINAADYVLRFNDPPIFAGSGWSGIKTDGLMLCNSGKPMQLKLKQFSQNENWLSNKNYDKNESLERESDALAGRDFLHSPFLQAAQEVILVYHPEIIRHFFKHPRITSRLIYGRKRDWTWEAIEKLGAFGKKVSILPPQFYLQACAELGFKREALRKVFPSTGYLGIWQMLQQCPSDTWSITLAGFSWQGWKRHDWQREEDWVRSRVRAGHLSLIESSSC